jgi:hypothetical protein
LAYQRCLGNVVSAPCETVYRSYTPTGKDQAKEEP